MKRRDLGFLFIGSRKFLIVTPWEASRQIAKNGAEPFNHFKPSPDNKFPPIGKKKQNPTSYAKVQVILLRLQYASMLFRCSPDVSTQSNMEILGKQTKKRKWSKSLENNPNRTFNVFRKILVKDFRVIWVSEVKETFHSKPQNSGLCFSAETFLTTNSKEQLFL